MSEFKVGDRVRITCKEEKNYGECFVVAAVRGGSQQQAGGGYVSGVVGGRTQTMRFNEIELAPIDPLTMLNGKSYTLSTNADGTLTLTPVQEKEPEPVAPKVKRGQIWKHRTRQHLYLTSDEGDFIKLATGFVHPDQWSSPNDLKEYEYVAASLADGLEQGLIKPADLRP